MSQHLFEDDKCLTPVCAPGRWPGSPGHHFKTKRCLSAQLPLSSPTSILCPLTQWAMTSVKLNISDIIKVLLYPSLRIQRGVVKKCHHALGWQRTPLGRIGQFSAIKWCVIQDCERGIQKKKKEKEREGWLWMKRLMLHNTLPSLLHPIIQQQGEITNCPPSQSLCFSFKPFWTFSVMLSRLSLLFKGKADAFVS